MVYDYLFSSYMNKENNRYYSSAHKRSELKKIYTDIVKISKDSPSYLIKPSSDDQSFVIQLKEGTLSLQSTLETLQNGGLSSAFSYKEVSCSDTDSISTRIDTDDHSKLPEPFSIQIDKLATAQINKGNYIYRTSNQIKEGTYCFAIDYEGEEYPFTFQIPEKASNESVIKKVTTAINQSLIPITANAILDERGDKMRIALKSNQTGSTDGTPIFTCRDLNHPSSIASFVNFLGLNNMQQAPSNSSFSINGESKSTIANEFTLNNSLHVTLRQVTEEPVQVDFSTSSSEILSEVENIANTYNELVHLSYNQGNPPHLATSMLRDLRKMFPNSKDLLKDCGISFDEEGYMNIDKNVSVKSIRNKQFEKLFGANGSYSSNVIENIKTLSLDPMKYLENKVIVTYPDPTKEHFANPYLTSMYSGMLFNSKC